MTRISPQQRFNEELEWTRCARRVQVHQRQDWSRKPLYLPLSSKLSLLQVDYFRPKSPFAPVQRRERPCGMVYRVSRSSLAILTAERNDTLVMSKHITNQASRSCVQGAIGWTRDKINNGVS